MDELKEFLNSIMGKNKIIKYRDESNKNNEFVGTTKEFIEYIFDKNGISKRTKFSRR
jgi:hypothetical protein